jgi:hypothetical protein
MEDELFPADVRPLDLSEYGTTQVGGEAASTQYARETAEEAEDSILGLPGQLAQGVSDQFLYGGNYGVSIFKDFKRAYDNPYDPGFNPKQWIAENRVAENIGESYLEDFMGTGSSAEATDLLKEVRDQQAAQKRLSRLGVTGALTTGLVAGMVDVDTLLTLGGSLVGKAGLIAGTRLGAALSGTVTGVASSSLGEGAVPGEDDYANVALAGLLGAAVGGAIGPNIEIKPLNREANFGMEQGLHDLNDSVSRRATADTSDITDGVHSQPFAAPVEPAVIPVPEPKPAKTEGEPAPAPEPEPAVISPRDAGMDVGDELWDAGRRSQDKGSVGARQMIQTDAGIAPSSPGIEDLIDNANRYVAANRLDDKFFYDYGAALQGGTIARNTAEITRKTVDTLSRLGVGSDFDKLFKSGSSVGKMFAHTFLADPAARLPNRRNAAALRDQWRDQLLATWKPDFDDAFYSYKSKKGVGRVSIPREMAVRDEFYKDVMLAAEHQRIMGALPSGTDADVVKAVDALNRWSVKDLEIGKGDGPHNSVPGYDSMQAQTGYVPRKVTAAKQIALIRESGKRGSKYGRKYTEKDIEQFWTEFYSASGRLTKEMANTVAKMVISRAKAADRGADVNLLGLLQNDGKEFLHDALKAQGISDASATSIIEALVGTRDIATAPGHTQHRLDGDIRFVASNGIKAIDLIDTDLEKLLSQRSNSTAGRAAAARYGIRTSSDAKKTVDAILYQMQNNVQDPMRVGDVKNIQDARSFGNDFLDRDVPVKREFLEGLLDNFIGSGMVTDKTAGIIARLKRMTTLSTMGGLGLTQIAETGAIVGAIGFREFVDQLPAALKTDLKNPRSALIQELNSMGKLYPEERLHSPRFSADYDMTLHAQTEAAQMFDNLTGKGLQIQGMISGFYKVRHAQQKMAMMTTIDRYFGALAGKTGANISAARLATMGMDAALENRLRAELQHISWDGTHVKMLNVRNWSDPSLADEVGLFLSQATDTYVQKARLGESNAFFSGNGIASLFGQFLSYPIQAINKQMARNAYIGDAEAAYQLMWGFVFAGMVGMAKAVVRGDYDDIQPVEFARQGFMNANITGWVPLVSDPLMSLLGVDALKFNRHAEAIRSAPATDVINRTVKLPGSLAAVLTGNAKTYDWSNLKYAPVIGNWYGLTGIVNRLRD